jgi:hypothetical protein
MQNMLSLKIFDHLKPPSIFVLILLSTISNGAFAISAFLYHLWFSFGLNEYLDI